MTSRPYANDRSAPPSVTTILSQLSVPGLPWAAAKETATFAVLHRDRWQGQNEYGAIDTLRKHHRGVWDHRALIGTSLHRIQETWARGGDVRLADVVDRMRASSRLWQRLTTEELCDELRPMVAGLAAAWRELRPHTLSQEEIVRYGFPGPLAYIGTSDWRVRIHGKDWLVDLKTTGNTRRTEALYFDTWRLQLAAYRLADEAVYYGDDGLVASTRALPPVQGTAILHVRADGHFAFLPVQANVAEHSVFLALRKVYGWRTCEGQFAGVVDGSSLGLDGVA